MFRQTLVTFKGSVVPKFKMGLYGRNRMSSLILDTGQEILLVTVVKVLLLGDVPNAGEGCDAMCTQKLAVKPA